MSDVLKMIADLKDRLWKEYGNILRFTYTQRENQMTYYVSKLLEENDMGHDENYKWTQEAINAAFIAGMRVATKDEESIRSEINNQIISELQDKLDEFYART